MPLVATGFDKLLHLLLYVVAAGALGVLALAVVERSVRDPIGGRTVLRTYTVRAKHILISWSALFGLFALERLFHALT